MKTRLIPLYGISLLTTALLASGLLVALNGCSKETVKGSGTVITDERRVAEFNSIKLKGTGQIELTRGETHSISIQTDDNIMSLIETEVHADQLVISQKNYNLRPTRLIFNITVAHLKGVAISGSCDVFGKSRFVANDFFASISGSGDMVLELEVANLETAISGSGSMNFSGEANRHDVSISGSGKINAFDMPTRNVSLKVSGSGDCNVHAIETLNAMISGSGDVIYKGRPHVTSKINGSGKLESRH